jgi:hypothetical protein
MGFLLEGVGVEGWGGVITVSRCFLVLVSSFSWLVLLSDVCPVPTATEALVVPFPFVTFELDDFSFVSFLWQQFVELLSGSGCSRHGLLFICNEGLVFSL